MGFSQVIRSGPDTLLFQQWEGSGLQCEFCPSEMASICQVRKSVYGKINQYRVCYKCYKELGGEVVDSASLQTPDIKSV